MIFACILLSMHAVGHVSYTSEDLWSIDIIGKNKTKSLLINNYTGDRYDEIVDTIIKSTASWQMSPLEIILTMTPEQHMNLTGLDQNVSSSIAYVFWETYLKGAYNDSCNYFHRLDDTFLGYFLVSRNSFGTGISWLQVGHPYNEFPGQIKIKLTLRQGMRTNETEERDVRKRVNEIFTTGNLTGYGRENDLHTDYEKSVAIWWWIKENVEYGFSKRMENSAYGGIILGKAVDHGYSAMSGILLQRAGVEVRCLMGLLAKKKRFHAWNWLHIGEEWFAYDSTSSNAGNFLMGINTTNHLSQYKYSDGEYWDFPVSTSNYNYKFNSFSFPKNAPLLYQKEDTDSGLIGRNLKWTLKNGLLTIKGRGPMRNFENATQVPWKNFFYKILKLKIEETVTTIGDYAFYNIDKIKYQNYKDKLGFIQSIGQKAFSDYNDHVKTQVSYKIINLTFLDENEKENYKAQIVNASTLDKINEILLKAENKSKENENTQKTSAKDTIKKLPYLKSDSVKDFEEEINKAKDKESIKEVVTKAQSKNKELKVVFEKRETVKEEIKKLDKLGDMQKDYIEKLDKAHNEQEFDQILQDAKTKNEERQEEENAAQENKTNTIVMSVTVSVSIIVVLVAVVILVLVIRKQRYQSVHKSNEQSSKI